MKKIIISMACFFMLAVAFLLPTAHACTLAYFPWTWDSSVDTTRFAVHMCSSDLYMEFNASDAVFPWNGISPNLHIASYAYAGDVLENPGDINIHYDELPGTQLGHTDVYRKNWLGQYVCISPTSSYSDVVQGRISITSAIFDEADSAWRYKALLHELGHVFALRHPIEISCTSKCIMQQNNSGYETSGIGLHDMNNLIKKWGNK